ncbi:MAG: phage minor capsid protein [Ruminococcus sp.]|nr:phage minor capsid protein [Ruminococcus sp.]
MRQQYEPSADRIIALYQQLEDDILSAVIRRILKMGYVSEASKHQLEVLQAASLLYDDIVQLIADRTDACTAQVKALFEDAGVQTVEIDNSLHEAAGVLPIDIRQDSSTRQVLEAGYKKTLGTMQNLVSTTATQTQTAFIQACDRIYMQVSSGAFSYQEAIMNALRALADTGVVVYSSGHTDRMDVAVRRCVLTGVSQTAAAVSLRQAEDAGCYLMEITAHSGARPDHAKWQGQLVTITGKDAGKIIDGLRVFTFSEIGYGSGEGFKGWNCRHNWRAYYPGLSTPNYTPEELKKLDEPCISYNGKLYTEYEVSQMQRAQERRVRAWKRRCVTAQEGVNSATDEATRATAQAEFDRSARYLKTNEAKLKDFCRQTGQDRDRFREQVLGFDKSTAQKAVHAVKKNGLTSGGKDGIIREQEHMRSSSDYAVPKDLVGSRKFRSKFDSMDSDKSVQRQYYQVAKSMLQHRSGTNGEDLYFYNTRTKKWYKSTTGTKPGTPDYTEEIRRGLKESKKGEIVSFHNHPLGMPPSAGDLNAALKNGYKKGYTIGHDGSVFEYTKPEYLIDQSIYNTRISKYKDLGQTEFEAQYNTLIDLSRLYGFSVKEVK